MKLVSSHLHAVFMPVNINISTYLYVFENVYRWAVMDLNAALIVLHICKKNR